MTIKIYIDADAGPVKEETYKVAARYGLQTIVVSNTYIQVPPSPLIGRIIVGAGPDVADDWIAEQVVAGDVVVTNDIPLAGRVLAKDAHAVAPYGRAFTEARSVWLSRSARSWSISVRRAKSPEAHRHFRRPTGRSSFKRWIEPLPESNDGASEPIGVFIYTRPLGEIQ